MQTLLPPPLPPYPGPQDLPPSPGQYYRTDNRRLTWLECTRVVSSPGKVLSLWLGKLTGQIHGEAGGFPAPRPLLENLLSAGEVPPTVAGPIEALRRACEAVGFTSAVYHGRKNSLSGIDAAGCLLRESSGETLANLIYARSRAGLGEPKPARCILLSRLADDRLLVTSNGTALFNPPPGNLIARRVGAPVPALLTYHHRRLEAQRRRGNPPVPVRTLEEMAALCDQNERRAHEFHVARGLYVPMTAEEVAVKASLHEAGQQAAAQAATPEQGEETLAVLNVLHRHDHPSGSSVTTTKFMLLLAVSLTVFVVVGRLQWSGELLAIIVGVLLFHETGHYVAMRAFGYRNVRMFFIPFFGAAVSGLNPRAAGWQKAVVALAGPLPGLLLAAAVLGAQRFLPLAVRLSAGDLLAVKVAVVASWINGFNLLPLLPLDGGRFLHETLFTRRVWLRAGFAGAAGVGLFALGWWSTNVVLVVLGVLMLLSARRVRRVGLAVRWLQARDVVVTEPPSATAPEGAVRTEAIPQIMAALKEGRQAPVSRTILAGEAVSVIDQLRAQPPGIKAASLLLATYALAWALAVVPLLPVLAHLGHSHVAGKRLRAYPQGGSAHRRGIPRSVQ